MRLGTRDGMGIADKARRMVRRGANLYDSMTVVGEVDIVLFGEDGRVKQKRNVKNLVVTTGRDAIMERLDSSPATAQPSHMEIGSDSTAVAAGNTALGTAIDRNALTSSTASGAVLTMVANWAAGDGTSADIEEAGVFNNAAGGTMYSRATFTTINKGANDTLQITWTYTLTPS